MGVPEDLERAITFSNLESTIFDCLIRCLFDQVMLLELGCRSGSNYSLLSKYLWTKMTSEMLLLE